MASRQLGELQIQVAVRDAQLAERQRETGLWREWAEQSADSSWHRMRSDFRQLEQPTIMLLIRARSQMRRCRCSDFRSMLESLEVRGLLRDQTCLHRCRHLLGLLLQLLLEARVRDRVRYSVLGSIFDLWLCILVCQHRLYDFDRLCSSSTHFCTDPFF